MGNGLEIYETFINNFNGFIVIDSLPCSVKLSKDSNAQNLYDNQGKWHKACHLKFASSKLLKRKSDNIDNNVRKSSRISDGEVEIKWSVCFAV